MHADKDHSLRHVPVSCFDQENLNSEIVFSSRIKSWGNSQNDSNVMLGQNGGDDKKNPFVRTKVGSKHI